MGVLPRPARNRYRSPPTAWLSPGDIRLASWCRADQMRQIAGDISHHDDTPTTSARFRPVEWIAVSLLP